MNQVTVISCRTIYIIDNNITALGIRALLATQGFMDVRVCGAVVNFQTAFDSIGKLPQMPDLVIADISLGSGIDLEKVKQLLALYPQLKILILSAANEKIYAVRLIKAGATGFVSKFAKYEEIMAVIRKALDGKVVVSEDISSMLAQRIKGHRDLDLSKDPSEVLSDRELEVFIQIGLGLGTKLIAEKLHLSIKTVESHRAHIKKKMNLGSGAELMMTAITLSQKGLI